MSLFLEIVFDLHLHFWEVDEDFLKRCLGDLELVD
jgi:hypothetical protein